MTDPNSSWLGLAHGLKAIGVPFRITRDPHEAVKHHAVLVYPHIAGGTLPPAALQALARFARERGTLMAAHVLGGGLNELFGFDEAVVAPHTRVQLDPAQALLSEFTDPKEQVFPIGNAAKPETLVGTYGYTRPKNPPLAVFEDGSAAITQKRFEHGRAYAFGMDLGFLLLKGHNQREEGISRSYANDFEPTLDVLLRIIKNIYLEANPDAVTLSTVPFGKSLAAVISHDIDYNRSMKNAVAFAEFERSVGISATHFIQTKYVRDWNDEMFFDVEGVKHLATLAALGAEIGSHTVAHSKVMRQFAMGSGVERYPQYRPFVESRFVARGATILGELRVSKFLLENFVPGHTVVSFRPGHLQNPLALPQALAATHFRYSSSVTANTSLTHLPFRLNHDRGTLAETKIFEFPIAIEDELITDDVLWLRRAIDLAKKLSRHGGSFVVLIHTNEVGRKLEFERQLVAAIQPYAWFGSLREFGDWWAARDAVACDVEMLRGDPVVTLNLAQRMQGLTLHVPAAWQLVAKEPSTLSAQQQGDKVVIDQAEGVLTLRFKKSAPGSFHPQQSRQSGAKP